MRLGHSPDADDAFMFYAIAKEKVVSDNIDFCSCYRRHSIFK